MGELAEKIRLETVRAPTMAEALRRVLDFCGRKNLAGVAAGNWAKAPVSGEKAAKEVLDLLLAEAESGQA